MTLREIDLARETSDSQVLGLIRDDRVIAAPSRFRRIGDGDILVIEAQPEGLGAVRSDLGPRLEEAVADRKPGSAIRTDEVRLAERVVLQGLVSAAGRRRIFIWRSSRDKRQRQQLSKSLFWFFLFTKRTACPKP